MAVKKPTFKKGQEGQATTEYILLLAVIVSFFMVAANWISKSGLSQKLTALVTGPFAAAYRYGHTKAKGFDDGGPKYHPRAYGGENNFRIFLNPDS